MKVSFFNRTTGEFRKGRWHMSRSMVALNTPEGFEPIEGQFDSLTQRVDVEALNDGVNDDMRALGLDTPRNVRDFVIDIMPPKPDDDHEEGVDRATGRPRWVKKAEVVERERKSARARVALADLDLRSIRRLREISEDPELVRLEGEAIELRKDVVLTADEAHTRTRIAEAE